MKTTIAIAAALAACAAFAVAANAPAPVAGAVTGKVLFDGKKPEMKPLEISADQSKGCCEGSKTVDTTDRSMLIGADDGLANVVVSIDVDGAQVEALEDPIVLDQKECRFEPHVTVIPVGTSVRFMNSDAVAHNVHTYAGRNDSFNQTIAPGAEHTQALAKADRIEIKCDIHPWMNSWLIVTDTPHFAVTDASGSFQIDVPPGEYTVEVWHERLGKGKGKAVVAADGSSELVEVKLGAAKKKRRR